MYVVCITCLSCAAEGQVGVGTGDKSVNIANRRGVGEMHGEKIVEERGK